MCAWEQELRTGYKREVSETRAQCYMMALILYILFYLLILSCVPPLDGSGVLYDLYLFPVCYGVFLMDCREIL